MNNKDFKSLQYDLEESQKEFEKNLQVPTKEEMKERLDATDTPLKRKSYSKNMKKTYGCRS